MQVNPLQLDEIVQQIEQSFGEELPVASSTLVETGEKLLHELQRDDMYQAYLQDQTNRQIVRDFLVNAVMLGCISGENFAALSVKAGTREGRSALSLHMLMSSVEDANKIVGEIGQGRLELMKPLPGSPPHMVIVGS